MYSAIYGAKDQTIHYIFKFTYFMIIYFNQKNIPEHTWWQIIAL